MKRVENAMLKAYALTQILNYVKGSKMSKENITPLAASLALLLASAGVTASVSPDGQSASSLQTANGDQVQVSITQTPAVDEFIFREPVVTEHMAAHASHASHSSHSSHSSHASHQSGL